MATDNLQKVIDAAAQEIIDNNKKAGVVTPPLETPAGEGEVTINDDETPAEEVADEVIDENAEPELSEAQQAEAKNLYKALSGPNAKSILAALAQHAGILQAPSQTEEPLTKKEVIAAKREIGTIVAEALGPEYAFLQPKLAKMMDEVLTQRDADVETRFAEIQRDRIEGQVIAAYDTLAKETKGGSKVFETRMMELSAEVPVGNMDVGTYMRRLYHLAAAESGKPIAVSNNPKPQAVADKIRRNANDIPNRLRTSSAGPQPVSNQIPKEKMNLDQAVNWALGELQKGNRK